MTDKESSDNLPDFSSFQTPAEKTEFKELPVWVRAAVSMHELYGITWKEAAKRVGKSHETLREYRKDSPAVKAWVGELQEMTEDPKVMGEMMLKASGLGVVLEYLAAFEKAIEVNDHQQVGVMARDILDRIGIQKKAPKNELPTTINIVYSGRDGEAFEPIAVEAEYDIVDDDDDDEQKALTDGS